MEELFYQRHLAPGTPPRPSKAETLRPYEHQFMDREAQRVEIEQELRERFGLPDIDPRTVRLPRRLERMRNEAEISQVPSEDKV